MKYLLLIFAVLLTPLFLHGQETWLSTPESISAFRKQVELMGPKPSQFEIETINKSIPLEGRTVDIRIYQPPGGGDKTTLVYVHGACWVAGSLDSHDEICRYLALREMWW
jgi:acetyl esterase